jgi:hypothetical protein
MFSQEKIEALLSTGGLAQKIKVLLKCKGLAWKRYRFCQKVKVQPRSRKVLLKGKV